MTISISELRDWLDTLPADNTIAVGDDGLSVVALGPNDKETGAYYEIGGIPEEEDWSCDNCGNTDQDGSDTCIDCGQTNEED